MKLNILAGLSRTLDPNDSEPCAGCGHCCHYVTIKIDTPRARVDYDEIRWFLLHDNVAVFIDEDGWYVEFYARCRKLDGYKCGIYETRPKVCSDYKVDNCERYGEGDPFLYRFEDDVQYLDYLKKHRPRAFEMVMNPRPDETAKNRKPARKSAGRNGKSNGATNGNGHSNGKGAASDRKIEAKRTVRSKATASKSGNGKSHTANGAKKKHRAKASAR